jgi:hypothetical protein
MARGAVRNNPRRSWAPAGWNTQLCRAFLAVSLIEFTFTPLGLRKLLFHNMK